MLFDKLTFDIAKLRQRERWLFDCIHFRLLLPQNRQLFHLLQYLSVYCLMVPDRLRCCSLSKVNVCCSSLER